MPKRLTPNILFSIASILMIVVHLLLTIQQLFIFPYNLFGILIFVLGVLLNVRSNQTLVKHNNSIEPFSTPRTLVTDGPFSFSRHPVYLSSVIQLGGLAWLLGSLGCWLVVVAWWLLLDRLFVLPEEVLLSTRFGNEYRAYRKKVRRWF